jgi:hypothetical protein
VVGLHLAELLVEGKHPLDQGDHRIVAGFVGWVGEVDGSDGDF